MGKAKCIDCGKNISINAKRCKSCAKKGNKNGHYKDGIWTQKNYCPVCGKETLPNSKMCRSCATKEQLKNANHLLKYNLNRKGKNSPMFGKHHSKKSKQKMSDKHKNKVLTKIHKENISKALKGTRKGRNNPMFNKVTTSKRGNYNGIYMRSSWEIAYAGYLDKNNIKWLYESKTFDLGNTTYTPDFYLPETNEYIEIKGYWYNKALEKFKNFKKQYSNTKIEVLDEPKLLELGVL